jgi:hypothetical protein
MVDEAAPLVDGLADGPFIVFARGPICDPAQWRDDI